METPRHVLGLVEHERLCEDDGRGLSPRRSLWEIVVSPDVVVKAAEKVGFDEVRTIETTTGLSKREAFNAHYTCTRQGKSGTWREDFSADDIADFDSLREK